MSRSITIGNGNLLVGIDHRGHVRDFYFPYVGHSNHVSGASGSYTHRVGVWVDGSLKWLSDDSWKITISHPAGNVLSVINAHNDTLGVELTIVDAVHNEKNVFLREIIVKNMRDHAREIKVFFGQQFRISESRRGDTAYYDPRVQSVIHYKGHTAFLIHAECNNKSFTEYSIGVFDIEGKEGTFTDAEDGILSRNPIEHGSVDSVIGVIETVAGQSTALVHYWIAAGTSIQMVHEMHHTVLTESVDRLITSTQNYWQAWNEKDSPDLSLFEEPLMHLYKQSLQIIRVHADNHGGIIASSDSDMLNQGRDSYAYVWPRDAAISAYALDTANYTDTTERFFKFIAPLIEHDGYLMHKYRVDGVLGSSWHPWIRNGVQELPIQEDETALVVYMLVKHYDIARDIEFLESLYNSFIEPASNFMCEHIDPETGLPAHSYDLWEEKFGSSTYTASAVYGALLGASKVSALLGKRENAQKYLDRALLIKQAILAYLFDATTGMFLKLVRHENGRIIQDKTVDMSSFHGITFFGVLDSFDTRVQSAKKVVDEKLKIPTSLGGYIRYEGDTYYKTSGDAPSNPWCITTLWMAQYYILAARKEEELRPAYEILLWAKTHATQSGILPEQINPYTGEHLSTAPLVWSHAEFVLTIDAYRKKFKTFQKKC